ncbi:DUF6088 family protein [Dickeya oryzae]|uniref:DUF6088 family protein n=1 Tax=Dickeya oryzae TaxID=1240404 RepID=UPI001297C6FD|nr:DUF6088 family protein [Dickeya oryzae]
MPKLIHKSHVKVGINSYVNSYVSHQLPGRVFTHDQLIERKGITEDQRSATLKALSRMVGEKKIVRVSQGVYYRPRMSRFGSLPIEPRELITAVTKSKKVTIVPAGVSAVNALGLDTQLPMVHSFFTSERLRAKYNVKNVKFEYKESLQYFVERFNIKDEEQRAKALLFWSALSHINRDDASFYKDKLYKRFRELLTPQTQESFFRALPASMRWVSKSLI